MKTAIYIRTSTNKQDTGAESQLKKLKTYCELHNITNFKVYKDTDQSGKKRSRPKLDKMMKDIETGDIKNVITVSISRIGRSTKHLLEISDFFQKYEVNFISLSESINTTTPAGRLFFTLISAIAQFEREVIGERVKAGLENARSKGKQIGAPKKRNSELIKALRDQGLSYREIAIKAKCSLGSVQAELKN